MIRFIGRYPNWKDLLHIVFVSLFFVNDYVKQKLQYGEHLECEPDSDKLFSAEGSANDSYCNSK